LAQRRIISGDQAQRGEGQSTPLSVDDLSDRQKARSIRRHLVQRGANSETNSIAGEDSRDADDDPAIGDSSYHNLLGGDAVHDLYRWEQQVC